MEVDRKLRFRAHVEMKLKHATQALMTVTNTCKYTWGLPPASVNYFYRAIIRPKVTFGALIWHGVARHLGVQEKFKKFQRLALSHFGPIRPSCPTRGMEVLNYLRPLSLELRKIAGEAYIRTKDHIKVPLNIVQTPITSHKTHRQLCAELFCSLDFDLWQQPTDIAETTYFWDNKFTIDWASMLKEGNKKYGWPKNDAKFTIYTDGSLVNKPMESAGCGLYIWQGYAREAYRLGPNVSVYQSELQAIKKAAQFLLKNNKDIRGEICVIYVDNQAAIKSLGGYKTKSKLVINTVQLLNGAAKFCDKLIIRWVRSH